MSLPGRRYSYPYKLPYPWPGLIGMCIYLVVYCAVVATTGGTWLGLCVGFGLGLVAMVGFHVWVGWDDKRTVRKTEARRGRV